MIHVLLFRRALRVIILLLASVATASTQAATYYVSTTGQDAAGRDGLSPSTAWKSIAYAFQQVPAGSHTFQLGGGTFVLSQTAPLKDGWTLNGQGHTGSNTTTIINASTFSADGEICLGLANEKQDYPLENYLLGGDGLDDVTISNLILTSRPDQPLDGAIMMKYAKNLELFNLLVQEFPWNGIYLRQGQQVRIHHSFFEDASYERRCNTWGGALRTRYMKDFELDHCEFKTTKGGGYGYKASGHENARIHDNTFHNNVSKGPNDNRPFDLESAHEFEWGLEIYNNTFNSMVSVPRAGGQSHPSDRGAYTYTVRIHDNVFYGSGGVEGPRNYLEIDHNYFANKWGNNGRVYEIHGGANAGPTTIHHNVAECSMGFMFKKNELNENISILNNTVYLVNSDRNNFPTTFLEVSGAVKNWRVKNNVVYTLDAPNSGVKFSRNDLPSSGLTMSNNLAWNIPSTPAGVQKTDPGLALSGSKPKAYYSPKDGNSAVVDQGADVGFAFQGSAPDLGAYEWNFATPPPTTPPPVSGDPTVRFKNLHSGAYLRHKNSVLYMETSIKQDWTTVRWILEDAGDGYVRFKNVHSGAYLRHKDSRLYMEPNIVSDWTTVRWSLEDAGNGYVRFKNRNSGAYLRYKDGVLYMEPNIKQSWSTVRWKPEEIDNANGRQASQELAKKTLAPEKVTLALYPNPATDQLQVALPSGQEAAQLRIYDLLGRLWLDKVLPESESVDVSRLPVGVYTVRLQQGAQWQTQKLLIE
ncbi:MAG: RICIN domain-containing protein [Tunicatimonas sp.]